MVNEYKIRFEDLNLIGGGLPNYVLRNTENFDSQDPAIKSKTKRNYSLLVAYQILPTAIVTGSVLGLEKLLG